MHTHIRFIYTRKEQYFAEVFNNLTRYRSENILLNHQNNYVGN